MMTESILQVMVKTKRIENDFANFCDGLVDDCQYT